MSEVTETGPDEYRVARSKVGRLIDKYDLESMDTELAQYWQGEGCERYSLRDLATHFNHALMQTAMVEAGLNPIAGEAENNYALLTKSETTRGTQRKAERRLERAGIDIETLKCDFVSHQAIHTYLTDVRGLEYDDESSADDIEGKIETIQRLIGRTRSVSKTVVNGLMGARAVEIGEYDISADVQITCRDCNTQYDIAVFLRQGHCECNE